MSTNTMVCERQVLDLLELAGLRQTLTYVRIHRRHLRTDGTMEWISELYP